MAQAQPVQAQQTEVDRLSAECRKLAEQGQYQEALRICQQTADTARQVGDLINEVGALWRLGIVYHSLEQYKEAIEGYQQTLKITQEIGAQGIDTRSLKASLLEDLGEIHSDLSQYEQAIKYYQQLLEIVRDLGERQREAESLNKLANAYAELGQYSKAISFDQQLLEISRNMGDRDGESVALSNLGATYNDLGQYPNAINYFEQSLKIKQDIGDRNGEAVALNGLGNAYNNLGQYPKAIDYYEQSLKIKQDIGNRNGEASSLYNLGNAYASLGQYPKAIDYYEQSLKITQEIGDRNGEAYSLYNLGNAYASLGQYPKAIDYYEQSLKITQEIGDRNGEASSLNNLGYALFRTNQLTKAETYLKQSIEVFETLRLGLSDAEKLSLFETLTNPYYTLQEVLVTQEKNAEALEIAERSRARAFVELLAQRLAPADIQNLAESQVADAITIDQIKQVAHDQNATLVEYSIAAASRLYIWVVSPSGDIAFRSVDLSKLETSLNDLATTANSNVAEDTRQTDTTLSLLVQGTRSAIDTASDTRDTDPDSPDPLPSISANDPRFDNSLQQLYQILIDPIQDLLPTDPEAHVIFIPHETLFLTPFPALQAPDSSYLVQHHTLRTAPSIQVLQLTHQQRQQQQQLIQKALVVGNPTLDLPAAEQEANAVADFLHTTPLIGQAATKAAVVQQMPDAHLIHLAAHAAPTAVDESYGGLIVLADPKAGHSNLTTNEILQLKLQAEMVVLSGCNTGVSDIINSDGVVGLARSLISAGTPSVIMSLWSVPDAPTALLMQKFYQYWKFGSDRFWLKIGFWLLSLVVLLGALFLIRKPLQRLQLRQLNKIRWRQLPHRLLVSLRHLPIHVLRYFTNLKNRSQRTKTKQPFRLSAYISDRSRSIRTWRLWRVRPSMRMLSRRWKLAIGLLLPAVVLLSAIQLHQPQPMDKAQALCQAMLTTMKTHPEPRAWAAFTLMGEAE